MGGVFGILERYVANRMARHKMVMESESQVQRLWWRNDESLPVGREMVEQV